MNTKTVFSPKGMAKIGILSGLAVVLMLFEFPLPIAPSFYKLDFSELAVLLGGFSMGPMAAVMIEALKNILNVIFTGSGTAYVGEFANFAIGALFTATASAIYHHNKSKKSAIIGMAVGTVVMAAAGAIVNALVMLPMYSTLYNMPMDVIIGMGSAICSWIKDIWTFCLFAVVPFNIVKGIIISILTALIYKHVSPILHR
ncbi:MAG: ECF transporter S component [Erysipelotrichaceae bacterium]|nr:ECF transporter S component [Erysipelotrichaceae bacterium]